jgi:hypothetical protein
MEESVFKGFGVSVTLFAGYLVLRCSPYRRFKAEHLRTDRFALHVLGFALLAYAISVLVASVIEREFKGGVLHNLLLIAMSYTHLEAPVICSVLVAPLLGVVDSLRITYHMRRDPAVTQHSWWHPIAKTRFAAVARFILECDDAATRLLHRATIFRKPIMLTLKSGKVYVGAPVGGIGDPSVRAQSIKIIPLLSGYRDPDTHKVNLPTRYKDIYAKMDLKKKDEKPTNPQDPLARDIAAFKLSDSESIETDMQDIGVVVLWSEIQSLSLYDDNIYSAFQAMGPPTDKRKPAFLGKDGLLSQLFSALGLT